MNMQVSRLVIAVHMTVQECTNVFRVLEKLCTDSQASSIYSSRSGPMLRIFLQLPFELFTLLLCGQSQLFKVETYCSRTGAYCYGVKTYYNQQ